MYVLKNNAYATEQIYVCDTSLAIALFISDVLLSQGMALAYLLTSLYGEELWHFYTLPGLTAAQTFRWMLILGFVGSIPLSLWNIYDHYSKSRYMCTV